MGTLLVALQLVWVVWVAMQRPGALRESPKNIAGLGDTIDDLRETPHDLGAFR